LLKKLVKESTLELNQPERLEILEILYHNWFFPFLNYFMSLGKDKSKSTTEKSWPKKEFFSKTQ